MVAASQSKYIRLLVEQRAFEHVAQLVVDLVVGLGNPSAAKIKDQLFDRFRLHESKQDRTD